MAVPWMAHFMLEQDLLREWIKKAKAGDADAFERILLLHERMVLRFAERLLGNSEDAKDAAQEVFVRLHRHLGRFREESEFGPWLYRITANVCHDVEQTCSLLSRVEDAPSAEDLAEVRRRVLGRLKRRQRPVWAWSTAAAAAVVALACFFEYPAEPPLPAAPQIAAVPPSLQDAAAQTPPRTRPQPRRVAPISAPPGIRSVALVSQPDGPPLIKIATTDPHVLILLASDERTKTE